MTTKTTILKLKNDSNLNSERCFVCDKIIPAKTNGVWEYAEFPHPHSTRYSCPHHTSDEAVWHDLNLDE